MSHRVSARFLGGPVRPGRGSLLTKAAARGIHTPAYSPSPVHIPIRGWSSPPHRSMANTQQRYDAVGVVIKRGMAVAMALAARLCSRPRPRLRTTPPCGCCRPRDTPVRSIWRTLRIRQSAEPLPAWQRSSWRATRQGRHRLRRVRPYTGAPRRHLPGCCSASPRSIWSMASASWRLRITYSSANTCAGRTTRPWQYQRVGLAKYYMLAPGIAAAGGQADEQIATLDGSIRAGRGGAATLSEQRKDSRRPKPIAHRSS